MNDSDTHTTTAHGGSGGEEFSDTLLIGDLATAAISEISMWHSSIICCLEVKYTCGEQRENIEVQHGMVWGSTINFKLDDDEFITHVEGYSSSSYIYQLTFVTNKRTCGPTGNRTGEHFRWGDIKTDQGTQVHGMRLVAFSGRASNNLIMLQGIFYNQQGFSSPIQQAIPVKQIIPSKVNYEGIPDVSGPGGTGVSAVPFSTFTSHLISPVRTLYAGQDRIELHVHEDTLCKLSSLQAALEESFQVSMKNCIEMPEDDPRMVSALIEYLYTGNYTYPYPSTSENLGSPIATLTEGQYHVCIFEIASKYDCQGLAAMAMGNFKTVLPDLDSIDTLRLWKAAYGEGPGLQTLRNSFNNLHSGKPLASWVKELFKNHREELNRTIKEFPELASDLLRLATCGDD
ncbi:hypothetical protein Q9L58_008910 [Maublancomyces gigas]|uniref:Jacalin-type lectin domain-containing protein n=1 Tax=Discina gigas TaxID=1032678 RepID=A0ABR3G8V1_9PEZI